MGNTKSEPSTVSADYDKALKDDKYNAIMRIRTPEDDKFKQRSMGHNENVYTNLSDADDASALTDMAHDFAGVRRDLGPNTGENYNNNVAAMMRWDARDTEVEGDKTGDRDGNSARDPPSIIQKCSTDDDDFDQIRKYALHAKAFVSEEDSIQKAINVGDDSFNSDPSGVYYLKEGPQSPDPDGKETIENDTNYQKKGELHPRISDVANVIAKIGSSSASGSKQDPICLLNKSFDDLLDNVCETDQKQQRLRSSRASTGGSTYTDSGQNTNRADGASTANDEYDIDLVFVEKYQIAFNAFLQLHPQFLERNPVMTQNMRVLKLQRLLEVSANLHAELNNHLQFLEEKKEEMALSYYKQLREVSHQKAAREIQLERELNTIQQATRVMEGRLTWQLLASCEESAKKNFQRSKRLAEVPMNLHNLLTMLPELPETEAIREAVTAPVPSDIGLSEKQEKDMRRQFQVDNALLSTKVTNLENELVLKRADAKQHAWIDAVFLRMDKRKLKTVKRRYRKKLGVTF